VQFNREFWTWISTDDEEVIQIVDQHKRG